MRDARDITLKEELAGKLVFTTTREFHGKIEGLRAMVALNEAARAFERAYAEAALDAAE